jgi:hypothetical protein
MTIKISYILIAILSGWIFSEVKDFILNGGFENKLATILLKIILLMYGIALCAFFDFNYQKYLTPIDETPTNEITAKPFLDLNKSLRSISKSHRSGSKSRRTRASEFFTNSE